jgi:2-polyprenyl-6-methoxyphenol hydroxylase-like FAD-dependent oxidoreductase
MIAGFLLARAGVDVVVLEKHADFLRDFRGDTIHPSTLELMYELGILDDFLRRPHQELRQFDAQIEDATVTVADFSHLPTHCKFIALMPQWDFLNFIAEKAHAYPQFHLRMESEVTDLIEENGRIAGVRAKTPAGSLEVRADLTLGTDGRHSIVRQKAGLKVIDLGAPIDVLWMRLSRKPDDPEQTLGRFRSGKILVMLNRGDYWQCAHVIAKGEFDDIRRKGLAGVSGRHYQCRSLFARAHGGIAGFRRHQTVDSSSGSLAAVVASRSFVPGRFDACYVSSRRGRHQFGNSGCGCGGQYSGSAIAGWHARQRSIASGAGAARVSDADDATVSGFRAQTLSRASFERARPFASVAAAF